MKLMIASLSFEPTRVSDYPGVNSYSIGLVKALTDRGIRVRVVTLMPRSQPKVKSAGKPRLVRGSPQSTNCGALVVRDTQHPISNDPGLGQAEGPRSKSN